MKLNTNQQKAVNIISGSAMIIAGAGSGKTRVITERINNLICHDFAPEKIVALTFTNKAAKEMKERLSKKKEEGQRSPFIGTFHSYCLMILRRFSVDFGLDTFTILDPEDQVKIVKNILKKFGLEKELLPKKVLAQISMIKNQCSPNLLLHNKKIIEIYQKYENAKTEINSLDFDDLMLLVYKKICSDSEFKNKIQRRIDHILIDEYQDTNDIQHKFLKQLATDNTEKLTLKSIFAVGDQDQSIYSWRGAVVENIEKFRKDFAPTQVIKIEQNYRCVQPILEAANQVINNNSKRIEKKLWSEKQAQNRIFYLRCKNEYQEAEVVAHFAKQIINKNTKESFAILYRNHSQSRALEEKLIHEQMQYKIVGGIRFYERKEIKDLLAYLKLFYNPLDLLALERIINVPTRGLGEKFVELLRDCWAKNQFNSFSEHLTEVSKMLPSKKGLTVASFLEIFKTEEKLPSQILEHVFNKINYEDFLKQNYEETEAETKIKNIEEFLKSIYFFEKKWQKEQNKPASLGDFLHEIALLQENNNDQKNNNDNLVQIMSLHSAKGLEFDNVVIVGLEDYTLPSLRTGYTNDDTEEDRRLFYVGITRAKERLLISSAATKFEYGQVKEKAESRFITEIPENLLTQNNGPLIGMLLKNKVNAWLAGKNIDSGNFYKTLNFNASERLERPKPFNKYSVAQETTATWKINSLVRHSIFGHGFVKKVSGTGENVVLTVNFKIGEKKISSKFVKQS